MIAVILALLSVVSLAQEAPPSLAGRWLLRIDSPQGPRDVDVELEQDGTTLSGTYVDERGTSNLKGRYVEGKVSFAVLVQGPDGAMTIQFSGRTAAGGKLSGTLSAPMGDLAWSAERFTAPAANPTPHKPANPHAAEPAVSGTWVMKLQGPRGDTVAQLQLKQDGTKISGSLTLDQGWESPVRGEYAEGKLTFVASMQTPDEPIDLLFRGETNASGGLSGTMSGPRDVVPWSATRQKDKRAPSH